MSRISNRRAEVPIRKHYCNLGKVSPNFVDAGFVVRVIRHDDDFAPVFDQAHCRPRDRLEEQAEANLQEAMHQLFGRRGQSRFYRLEFGKSVVRTFTP